MRLEKKIAVTFVIVLILGFFVNGVYCTKRLETSWASEANVILSLFMACGYLVCIWKDTKKYRKMGVASLIVAMILMILAATKVENIVDCKKSFSIYDVIPCAYGMFVAAIASIQVAEILKN